MKPTSENPFSMKRKFYLESYFDRDTDTEEKIVLIMLIIRMLLFFVLYLAVIYGNGLLAFKTLASICLAKPLTFFLTRKVRYGYPPTE